MADRILVIDDDVAILRLIRNILNTPEYEVVTRNRVDEINLCDFSGFDLILLDVMMPLNGLDICKSIRKEINTPILLITAKDMEQDLVEGIQAGADDYVTKPFSVQAFLARIRMHLRREERYKNKSQALTFGALTICPDSQSVWIEDHEIQLTKREFVIVLLLAGRTGKVFSIEEIYDRVYPQSANTQFRSISEYIYQIRSKFRIYGINPIETMRGGGYRWKISSASTN